MQTQQIDLNKFIGLDEQTAREFAALHGMTLRVRSKDGEAYLGTCDFRQDRVNVGVRDGKVFGASIG